MANTAHPKGSDIQPDQPRSEGGWKLIWKWFENNWSQVLFFVGGLALYLLLGLFLWWLLQRYVDPSAIKDPSKEATAKKDLLQALGLIMAGVAGAIGIFFTWRGQKHAREAQLDNQRNTRQQLDISLQGQITDRFTRSIELLGATIDGDNGKIRNVEQRLGAIFALEEIARESDRHYYPILDILAAYVRQNAPLVPEAPDLPEGKRLAGLGHAEHDIQAILGVIGQLSDVRTSERRERINLAETDLRNTRFLGGQYAHIWFVNADLQNAGFINPDLRGAVFKQANLKGAVFHGRTKLESTDFEDADLEHTYFTNADLTGVINLTQEQIDQAYGDANAKLPPYLQRPGNWD